MMKNETPERRGAKRYSVTMDIEWEHVGVRREGTLADLSETGCFVLSGYDLVQGCEVELFIPLGDGIIGRFGGVVANSVRDIGFAVRFLGQSEEQRAFLRDHLKSVERAEAEN